MKRFIFSNHVLRSGFAPAFLLALLLTFTGCKQDDSPVTQSDQPTAALGVEGGTTTYTVQQWNALLANSEDEGKLYEKAAILTYAMTEFIGSTGTGNEPLAFTFPCEFYLDDMGGPLYRFLGDISHQSEQQVTANLNTYICSLITDCNSIPVAERNKLWESLALSLVLEGQHVQMRGVKPKNVVHNSTPEIFLSYGRYSNSQAQDLAAGFSYNLQSGIVTHQPARDYASASAVNMVVLELHDDGPQYMNDPCWHLANPGGGGGSGGGSGGGGLDDDGAYKGYQEDPLIFPDGSGCSGTDGVRLVKFHLSDRNEGKFVNASSEVWVSLTIYKSSNPLGTAQINTGAEVFYLCVDPITTVGYNKTSPGMQIADVHKDYIKSDVNTIITNSGDGTWVLMQNGFCSDPVAGFDRMFITFYERDKGEGVHLIWQVPELTLQSECQVHRPDMHFEKDMWFSNRSFTISPDNFTSGGGHLWLKETSIGYAIQSSQPGSETSWFELELF